MKAKTKNPAGKTKRKRAKPVDHRMLPEHRPALEIIRKYGLVHPEDVGFQILWYAKGQWDGFDAWFEDPRVKDHKPTADIHMKTKAAMHAKQEFFDNLYHEALVLYQDYLCEDCSTEDKPT